MKEVLLIDDLSRAAELLNSARIDILSRLMRPRTCPELARELGLTTQKVNYHVRVLSRAGLVTLLMRRRNRGTMEGIYQAAARSFWLSPRFLAQLGKPSGSTELGSFGELLDLATELQEDIDKLANERDSARPQISGAVSRIEFRNAQAQAQFESELNETLQRLTDKYAVTGAGSSAESSALKVVVVRYQEPDCTEE